MSKKIIADFTDTAKIVADSKFIVAKYRAWARTPKEERPQDLKYACVMNIEPGKTRWPDYITAVQEQTAKLGFNVSNPMRVVESKGATVLVCEVSRIAG